MVNTESSQEMDREMEYRKNQEIELRITDLGAEGEGIGRTDAFLWFVKGAIPGDLIRASVMKVKKSYGYARIQKILEASPDRVAPLCSVASACGGCSLQMMRYEAQLAFKEKKVLENLRRIGGLELSETQLHPIIGMDEPFRYRNKAQFPVGTDRDGNVVSGFYAGRTHSIIPCGDCLIGAEENEPLCNVVLEWMREYHIPAYDERSGEGFVRHILIRKGFWSGEIMVCLVTNGAQPLFGEMRRKGKSSVFCKQTGSGMRTFKSVLRNTENAEGMKAFGSKEVSENAKISGSVRWSDREAVLQTLAERLMQFPAVKTVVQNINMERNNVILGNQTAVLSGSGVITDRIGEIEFAISAQSFYQVNPVQTQKLYAAALRCAGLTGQELVWDLYCGIGTISLFLARSAGKVYGVEIVSQAIADARRNAERNGISNAEFFVGKAEEVLPEQYARTGERADVIVVDPPRKGCDPKCLSTMLEMAPERIVYVSCDSATLARDLKFLLADGRYQLKEVQPVDMFPQTSHVECIALIQRAKS